MLPTTADGVPLTPHPDLHSEGPQLKDRTHLPRGVVRKNLKQLAVIGCVLVVVLAGFVSSFKKKPPVAAQAKSVPAVPATQSDATANNVAALHSTLGDERRRQLEDAQVNQALAAQPAVVYGVNGLPAVPTQGPVAGAEYGSGQAQGQAQLSPAAQEAQQLAAKERERQYASRFESNLVYSRSMQQEQAGQGSAGVQQAGPSATTAPSSLSTNVAPARMPGEQPASKGSSRRAAEVNVDSAVGQPYVLYEGSTLDTVLMNRLDGDAAGTVKVLVSNPVYSHDHQHVLVPEGTVVLGEARKLGASGVGQQRRMAIVFHRLLMPDGYSVDLDQSHGVDQVGQEGLKDKVDNHYLQIFGTSVALGVISGAAQITEGGGAGYNATGSQTFVNGAVSGISQQATTVLDRFLQIPPTITIREGHRVKVYFTQDMLLPAYENHRIAQSF